MVLLTTLLGMAALTVDLSYMWNVRADLQRAADAAALAATASLAENEDAFAKARVSAQDYVERNAILNETLHIALEDVEIGRADLIDGEYVFTPVADGEYADAVRIQLQATRDFFFGQVLGRTQKTLGAAATALLVPRDIAIVADLSASHNDDSELGSYLDTNINVWEVWDALPGGSDSDPSTWTPESLAGLVLEPNGFNPQSAGPAWGYFRNLQWGETNVAAGYDPNGDSGLVHLARYDGSANGWSNPNMQAYLASLQHQGGVLYSAKEVEEALDTTHHGSSSRYERQVAVALGLARWDSGKPGGAWQSIPGAITGNGDDRVDSWEMTWVEPYFDEPGSRWLDYIYWASSSWTRMAGANASFRSAFGPKTFVDYLMEQRWSNAQTPELAATPHQPMQAVKDAVEMMVDLVGSFENNDQIALDIYGYTALHRVPLQSAENLALVTTGADGLSNMQAGHIDGWTNVGGGLEKAIETLSNSPARYGAHKMIVLLTDGQANVNEVGEVPPSNDSEEAERVEREAGEYATRQAEIAASLGIRVFAVSVGAYADTTLMDELAAIGNGEHLEATSNDIAEYESQLQDIFVRLGGKRPVELIN